MFHHTKKQKLLKRMQWLFQVEGMNVVMFLGVLLFLNATYGVPHLLFLSYGLLLACFIFFQGAYYWWTKFSVLKKRPILQRKTLTRFHSFKRQNIIGILLIPFALLLQWVISGYQFVGDNFLRWAAFVNGFAILEYINYYHKQLMYDNRQDIDYLLRNRKLKEAALKKDLIRDRFHCSY